VPIRTARFAGEYAALSAWTGESEDQLRRDEDLHAEEREHWLAWDGDRVVGALHPWRSPDGRLRLYFDRCRDDAYRELVACVHGDCVTQIDLDDTGALTALRGAGFRDLRMEHEYEIPVRAFSAPVPQGLRIVTADLTELEPLMTLDCALREDTPGSKGWKPDPVWFREETYDSPYFDPQTYLVALDGESYVGLARVWRGPGPDRLGLVGVLGRYRRRGLARALISRAFAALEREEVASVRAEADAGDSASANLFRGLGAVVVGGSMELHRAR
jgi:ribosomal protein S18 acetylase RimI-like enzyme